MSRKNWAGFCPSCSRSSSSNSSSSTRQSREKKFARVRNNSKMHRRGQPASNPRWCWDTHWGLLHICLVSKSFSDILALSLRPLLFLSYYYFYAFWYYFHLVFLFFSLLLTFIRIYSLFLPEHFLLDFINQGSENECFLSSSNEPTINSLRHKVQATWNVFPIWKWHSSFCRNSFSSFIYNSNKAFRKGSKDT